MKVTHSCLVNEVAQKLGITRDLANLIIRQYDFSLFSHMINGDAVVIPGIGKFYLKPQKNETVSKTSQNLKTPKGKSIKLKNHHYLRMVVKTSTKLRTNAKKYYND